MTIIKDSEFIDNQCHEGGAALVLETSSIPTLKNLKFIRNKFLESAGEGVVSLYSTSSSKSYVFSDCTFEDNDTPIYAYLIQDLTIENCQFISAHGSTIGFLNFEAKIDEYSTLSIKNTKYLNNKQGDGHILLDSAGTKSTIKLRIEDSEFINSSGGESLLYISDSISLDNSSVINNTRFIENHVTLIRTYIKAGTLTVNSSIFDRNVAVYGVVLYSEHASPAKIVFSDCEISNNEGDSIIHVTSNTGIPLLETYNCNIFNNRNNTILLHHTLWLEKGSYIKNNENYMGGAVVLETDTNADLENTIFEENLSLNDGGAI